MVKQENYKRPNQSGRWAGMGTILSLKPPM